MNDDRIIQLYQSRSEQAISETSAKYGNYCHSIAYNILHSREDSEECVNDTWLRAWNAIPPRIPKILSVFLGKITRNLSLNRLEKYSAQKRGGGELPLALEELEECVPARSSTEAAYDESMLTELLNGFLAAQKKENRRLFLRRYWYLCSIGEIAAEYGLSESAVKTRLYRMRKELRDLLTKEGYDL